MHSTQNIIFNCSSKGNTLPNSLSSGSRSPWHFMTTTPSMKVTSPLRAPFLILIPPPITSLRQDLLSMDEKVYPWGVPPRVSFRSRHPHVKPLHQSAPWVDSVKHAALLVLAHSALFSPAIQHGEIFASDCVVLRAYHGPDGHDIHPVEPPNGKSLFDRPLSSIPERRPHPIGQAVPLGPPNCPDFGSRSTSPQNGW